MLDKAIVSVVCILVLFAVLVSMLGMMTQILKKHEFDRICRATLHEIDLAGGMSMKTKEGLLDKLESAGMIVYVIQAPEEVQYGDRIRFLVVAGLSVKQIVSLMESEERILYFSYEREIISRKIHNEAF
jgi:hypothetical protein